MDFAKLSAPFPKENVHWRVQGQPYPRNGAHFAMALAYLDARDVMDRLDEVCGPQNWQSRYTETAKGRVLCEIGIRIEDEWVWKSDGAGNTAVEGEKGGISDSLKRAAVQWGIGRYLYRLDSPWVRCVVKEKGGKTYWQRWDEDPWAKAKLGVYRSTLEATGEDDAPAAGPDAAQSEQPDTPQFSPAGARDRIKGAIENARTLPAVDGVLKENSETIKRLRDDAEPMYLELRKATEKRRKELGADSHQAPPRGEAA